MKSFWDHAYEVGDHVEHWECPSTPPELEATAARMAAGTPVLDVGCGGGQEAIFLARSGFRAAGVDSSRVAIGIARERAARAGVEVDFRCADVTALPFDDATFDFAYDRGCFHVVGRGERPGYARELYRVLRPGGELLIVGACADSEEEGVLAVDERAIDQTFVPVGFTRGPVVPFKIDARAGVLESHLVWLRRGLKP